MTPIFVNDKNIGFVERDTFRKSVCASRHFLRRPPAIAFDAQSLDDAERLGARFVEVTDSETNRVYRASIRRVRVQGFRVARGHGEQVALMLNEFNRDDDDLNPPAARVVQLRLWSSAI